MAAGLTQDVAEWAAGLRYEEIPEPVLVRARLQTASVLAGVFSGSRTEVGERVRETARRWGSGAQAALLPTGPRVPVHAACYANAAASVCHDFDDYLFAGHTGHSAVLGALAVGESTGAGGREVLAAQVAANEAGGRLGAALLFGPHNGQMWTYIHALGGAIVAGRLMGLDAEQLGHAIGLALAQPPYPLQPAFFGPDSKALMASAPLVEGVRAAELAAAGLTGAPDILGDARGVLASIAEHPLTFAFTGLGSAWVTESLTYKVYPGCAYVDTPVDALNQIREQFAVKQGRVLEPADVDRIRVEATIFTWGMEQMSAPYRDPGALRATDVNFSVALSFGVLLAAGEISAATLERRALETRRDEIMRVAERVAVEHDGAMTAQVSGLGDVGIDVGRYLAQNKGRLGARGDLLAAQVATPVEGGDVEYRPTLDGADFSRFAMRFPARVTLATTSGDEYQAEVAVPLGGAGRPLDEVRAGVRGKFLRAATHLGTDDAEEAFERAVRLDGTGEVRALVAALCVRGALG